MDETNGDGGERGAERNCASMIDDERCRARRWNGQNVGGDRAYELDEQRCENGRIIQKVKHEGILKYRRRKGGTLGMRQLSEIAWHAVWQQLSVVVVVACGV